MRTINISTVIGGVAAALPTKLSRKLLGGCACLGVFLLSSPSSAAAGFDTPGWSETGGGSVDGLYGMPSDMGSSFWWTDWGSSSEHVHVGVFDMSGGQYYVYFSAQDGSKGYTFSGNLIIVAPNVIAGINGAVESIVATANIAAPARGFSGTWSYVPSPSGSLGQLVYCVTDCTTHVAIDIKPGSPENTVNLGSQGVTKVAILGSEDFDATQVDPMTVELADATVKVKGNGQAQTTLQDTNGDGFLDLMLHMETEGFSLTDGDVSATLTGTTFGGEDIEGEDLVRVVP